VIKTRPIIGIVGKAARGWAIVLMAWLCLAVPFMTRAATVDDFQARTFSDGVNGSIPYRLFVPTSYNAASSSNYPILLYLHGAGERGTNNRDQLSLETAELVFKDS